MQAGGRGRCRSQESKAKPRRKLASAGEMTVLKVSLSSCSPPAQSSLHKSTPGCLSVHARAHPQVDRGESGGAGQRGAAPAAGLQRGRRIKSARAERMLLGQPTFQAGSPPVAHQPISAGFSLPLRQAPRGGWAAGGPAGSPPPSPPSPLRHFLPAAGLGTESSLYWSFLLRSRGEPCCELAATASPQPPGLCPGGHFPGTSTGHSQTHRLTK